MNIKKYLWPFNDADRVIDFIVSTAMFAILSVIWGWYYTSQYEPTIKDLRKQAAELAMENYELKTALKECQEEQK